ncbi:hypothetical protein L7F22_013080 [Adiantum nelumboides]|nr:hypothetical protein [Adiantum nelumboides]
MMAGSMAVLELQGNSLFALGSGKIKKAWKLCESTMEVVCSIESNVCSCGSLKESVEDIGERIARDEWDKLCSNYENKSATNKVFLMKKLFDICMKKEGTISIHINEFNIIFTQLTT